MLGMQEKMPFHNFFSASSLRKFVKISWIIGLKGLNNQIEMTVPSPIPPPDIKLVPSIITFMLNTLALE